MPSEGTVIPHRAYNRDVEIATSMVTCHVHENADGTVFLHFENEHGEFGVTLDPREAAELRATIAAAESSIKELRRGN